MLQEFLNHNLLTITDDAHVEKLKKSSDEIVKKLQKNKHKIMSYTLVALDPDAPADNLDFVEVKDIIAKNWNTFSANSKDTPLTFIRAVMLEALEIVSKDINLACLIWLSGCNIQKYFKLFGKEKELITNFLLSLGKAMQTKAVENWSLSSQAKLQKLNIEIKELSSIAIDKSKLEAHLKAASAHTNYNGENQYGTNNWDLWPNFFSKRAAQGISNEINNALKEQTQELSESQVQTQEATNKLLERIEAEIIEKNNILRMQTQLIWWRETCYSTSINDSYREQQNGLLQILLANDYSAFVPAIYPTSADFFLKETHRSLVKDERLKLSDILTLLEESKTQLKTIFKDSNTENSRVSLLNFIKGFIWGRYEANQIKDLVGLEDTTEITLSEFTLWIFHDFQSLKFLTSK